MSGSGSSRRGARHGGYAANSFRTEAIVLRTHRLGAVSYTHLTLPTNREV